MMRIRRGDVVQSWPHVNLSKKVLISSPNSVVIVNMICEYAIGSFAHTQEIDGILSRLFGIIIMMYLKIRDVSNTLWLDGFNNKYFIYTTGNLVLERKFIWIFKWGHDKDSVTLRVEVEIFLLRLSCRQPIGISQRYSCLLSMCVFYVELARKKHMYSKKI